MDSQTRQALNAINLDFYAAQAQDFSQTRDHPWPGWSRLLPRLTERTPLRVLDVGCGNARFADFLTRELDCEIAYTGVDSSAPLLEIARERHPKASFPRHDLVLNPPAALPTGPFDLIAVFGVMHHIPGEQERASLLAELAERLAPKGLLALTFWQFAHEERFEKHRVAWEARTIDREQLEAGDHLLRWGKPPASLRYCHDTSPEEQEQLTNGLLLQLLESFTADGRSGELNRYAILKRR